MGVAVPFNKLIQQTIPHEGWLSWLGLGRGGHNGGTCNCSNCTAKEVKQRVREANPPTFQTHFGFDEGLKSRKSDKESPKKTQTRLERQLPYNPGPGRVAPRANRPARRKPQRPLRSAAQRPAASARSSSFLARSSSAWKVQKPKKAQHGRQRSFWQPKDL